MKKLFLMGALVIAGAINAQNNPALAKGKWLIETNTNFGAVSPSNTSVSFSAGGGVSNLKIGGEAGYFIADNFALKAGLGIHLLSYQLEESSSKLNYKLGAKYYINSKFPVQIDLSGASTKNNSITTLGFQGGYSYFLAPNISIEPGLRYDLSLEDSDGLLTGNVGFALHF
ncbi:hypothetical protein KRX57_03840 [Weeksellaceae bacterium TAE3-ERU29]|nr:hypothetical protein [Weeksellaceae bacterium TAE3-ERU29]